MKRRWITIAVGLAIAAVAVGALACSSDSSSSNATKTALYGTPKQTVARTAASTPASTASSQGTPSSSATVLATERGTLGTILTDSEGRTVYKFADDQPNVSNCAGPCAQAWPPLTVAGGTPTSGDDVTGELGTIQRSDGATQVTYDGSPLYRYSGDAAAGDTNGNGLVGKWSVINLGD